MKSRRRLLALALVAGLSVSASRAGDPGREVVGEIAVTVFFGTEGDPKVAGPRTSEVSERWIGMLRSREPLAFAGYRKLGTDRKPVFRSYENWAEPITGSDEILCRFEVQKLNAADSMRLDLELWLSRKKILKSGFELSAGRPMLVLGPEWRGGRLILAVELADGPGQGP